MDRKHREIAKTCLKEIWQRCWALDYCDGMEADATAISAAACAAYKRITRRDLVGALVDDADRAIAEADRKIAAQEAAR